MQRSLRDKDIIFNNTNSEELVGKTAFWNNEGKYVLSNHMTIIRILHDNDVISQKYLASYLHKKWFDGLYLGLCRRHVNQASISLARLKEIQVPLPTIHEQQRIAAVLSAVQEAKEKTEDVIKATRELKKSLMKHLFTYGPVPVDEAENVLLKETEIGPIPEHWEVMRLGNSAELITKGSSPRWQGFEYCDRGIVFVRSQNVGWGRLELTEFTYLPEGFNKQEKKSILKKDDILINIVGASIGRVAIANDFVEGGNINQAIALVRLKKCFKPKFVTNFLFTDSGQLHLHKQKKDIARANLSLQDIGNLIVPLPPLPEQKQIAQILSAIDEKIEAEENKRKALEVLFKSLLSNLMTGRIRLNNLEMRSLKKS